MGCSCFLLVNVQCIYYMFQNENENLHYIEPYRYLNSQMTILQLKNC